MTEQCCNNIVIMAEDNVDNVVHAWQLNVVHAGQLNNNTNK